MYSEAEMELRRKFESSYIGIEDTNYYPYHGPLIYRSSRVQKAWEKFLQESEYITVWSEGDRIPDIKIETINLLH